MPEGITLKRIIDMDETEQLSSSDYVLVDSASGGNRKYKLGEDLNNLKDDLYSVYVTDTASGAIASFPDGADNVPVKSLSVAIEPVQAGSGDPSPENVRPISGHTQAKVTRCGVNVWDEEWEIGNINPSTGQDTSSTVRLRSKNYIIAKPNTSYYICVDVTQSVSWLSIFFYDTNKGFLSVASPNKNNAFVTPANTAYMRFIIPDVWGGADYVGGISINYPSTDHDYHAYNGQTITIDLGQTVYGGTLDVTSGVLTVDRALVDLGSLTWDKTTTSGNNYWFRAQKPDIKKTEMSESNVVPNIICSTYKSISANSGYTGTTGITQIVNASYIAVSDASYNDATAFKTAMNGQTLVYELAEPFEVTLTAHEVRTLLGTNNVFADCGDTTVEYRADTKLYIQKVLNA